MKPRDTRNNVNPSAMTKKEIRQANLLHRRMKTALAKDRADRDH